MGYPNLNSGEYVYDGDAQQYVLSAADAGKSVSGQLSFAPGYRFTTELHVIPAGGVLQVDHGGLQQITKPDGSSSNSVIFQYDAGVAYYPSGDKLTTACTYVQGIADGGNGPLPDAAGKYYWIGQNGYGNYTFDTADVGKEVVIAYLYLDPDYNAAAATLPDALTITAGLKGQPPSAHMEGAHPDQSVGYSLTALVEGDDTYLGTAGVMPNLSYEVMGRGIVGGGTLDADPIECAEQILTDPLIGVGFPSDAIDQASWFSAASSAAAWVKANQFYISQAVSNPTAAASIIGRWLEAFNIAAVYSEGALKLIPYGDESLGGFTPDLTIAADLDDDCFLDSGNSDPVQIARTPWADAYNRIQVSYQSRINSYNDDLVYEQDEASVERFGLRIKGTESIDFISSWQLASAVANMALKRLTTVRNTYEFKLKSSFEFLEPMDLVSLTDPRLGLDGKVVRITAVENDPENGLSVTCEDWPGAGYAMPVANPKAVTPANHPTQSNSMAGGTEIVIVQVANATTGQQATRLLIWCRGKDSSAWAGCALFFSLDGVTYEQIAVVTKPAPIFTLNAALAEVAASPSGPLGLTHDTANTISVAPATTSNQVVSTAGIAAWAAGTSYAIGASAVYDGVPWMALQANEAEVPTDASPFWQRMTSVAANSAAPASQSDQAASLLSNVSAVIGITDNAPSALEFLAFSTVAAGSAPNSYILGDLYRGALGSTPQAFAVGAQLVQFGSDSAEVDIPAGLAGTTVYFKAVPWNSGAMAKGALATAPVVEFVVADAASDAVAEGLAGPIGTVISPSGELIVGTTIGGKPVKGVGDAQQLSLPSETSGVLQQDRHDPDVLNSSLFGTQRNLVPDSGLQLGWAFWEQLDSGCTIAPSESGNGLLMVELTGWRGASVPVSLVAGTTYTLSALADVTPLAAAATVGVEISGAAGDLCEVDWLGTDQSVRRSKTFTASATETATLEVFQTGTQPKGTGRISHIQLEIGPVMTAYRPNFADDATGYIPAGALDPTVVSNAATALEVADGKAEITVATSAPAAPHTGDIWYNTTTTPAAAMVWNGSGWVAADSAAQAAASSASSLAGTKAKVTIGASAPASPATGDIWVNDGVSPQVVNTWNGSTWALSADVTAGQPLGSLSGTADNIAAGATNKFAAETGADVTRNHIQSFIAHGASANPLVQSSWTQVPEMIVPNIAVKSTTDVFLVIFSCSLNVNSNAIANVSVAVAVNGDGDYGSQQLYYGNTQGYAEQLPLGTTTVVTGLSPGNYNISVQAIGSGASFYLTYRTLTVQQVN